MKKAPWIAVGAFGLLLVLVFATREPKVSVGVQRATIVPLKKEQIVSVELSGPKTATLKKVGDAWTVSDPAHPDAPHPADVPQVDAIVAGIADLKPPDIFTSREERSAELEVDAAHAEHLKVFTATGPVMELLLGKAAPQGGCYLRVAGQQGIFHSPTSLVWAAKKSVNELRRKQLASITEKELREVAVSPAGEKPYVLTRTEAGKPWSITSGKPERADFRFDAEAANRIGQQLVDLRAQEFLEPGQLGDDVLGLTTGASTIRGKTADGSTLEVKLGRPATPDDGRLASMLRGQFDAVDGETNKDGRLTLDELKQLATKKTGAAHEAVEALAKDSARFARFDTGAWALSKADGGITPEDLDAVSRTGSLVPVRVSGNTETFLVPTWGMDSLTHPVTGLRDLSLLGFDVTQAKELTYVTAGKARLSVERVAKDWKLREPKVWTAKSPFDPNRVLPRLSETRRWRAVRLAEGVSEKQAGLNPPTAMVKVVTEDGKSHELRLGKPVPGKTPPEHYARGSVDTLIYIVGDGIRSTLMQGPSLLEKPPAPPSSGTHGLENLPPEVRRQIEAMQTGGGP